MNKSRHTSIECWLYWYTAFGVAMLGYLSSEDAYKYCNPHILFWSKALIESSVGGFNAVKAFRSMTFSRAYNQPDPKNTTSTTESVEVTTVTPKPNATPATSNLPAQNQ